MRNKINLISLIKEDLQFHGGIALTSAIKVFCFDASFRVVLNYRIGYYLVNSNKKIFRFISNYYRYKLITKRSCDISYKAQIGRRIKFPHPLSIIIGDNVRIMDDVKIWQSVTIGSNGKQGSSNIYPTILNRCKIYPGSIIVGPVEIGENVIIGANSFVNQSIPNNKTAIGSPARILE